MVDMTSSAIQFASDAQKRAATAADFGLTAFKPILHFQAAMLRMWADSIERFASNYEKGADKVATTVREQSDRENAA